MNRLLPALGLAVLATAAAALPLLASDALHFLIDLVASRVNGLERRNLR